MTSEGQDEGRPQTRKRTEAEFWKWSAPYAFKQMGFWKFSRYAINEVGFWSYAKATLRELRFRIRDAVSATLRFAILATMFIWIASSFSSLSPQQQMVVLLAAILAVVLLR